MSNDDNQDLERNVRDRIANFIQADERAEGKQAADEELQTLRLAAGRLDRQLADDAKEEQVQRKRAAEIQLLRAAAARLDRLLTAIARNEAIPELTRWYQPKSEMTK
jgi:hypothetical protein